MRISHQNYTSADTCIRGKISRVYKAITDRNVVILDYGGGKYNDNAEYMYRTMNDVVYVFDPYNRTEKHNQAVLNYFKQNKAKYVVCSNVLNVIYEESIILEILSNIKSLMSKDGKLYITVYERNKSGIGCVTPKGWQRNEKTDEYIKYIRKVFGNEYNIVKKNNILVVSLL